MIIVDPVCMNPSEDDQRERDERIIGWFENSCHILKAFQSHQRGEAALRMSLDAWLAALGFFLVAGGEGPTELAKRNGVSKQCFGKALNHFIEQLRLEPLPFQRKEEARENMSKARKSQLCPPGELVRLNPGLMK